ncbi:MAG TPA: TonB-dependent siderophore receptor [Rhizomicrobium sp.]
MFVISHLTKTRALTGASLGVLALLSAPAQAQSNSGPVTLGPVTVQSDSDKNALNHTPPVSTMPSATIQDTPQAVTVITGEVMKQQATTTLGDALRNVPGITIAIGEGGTLAGDQFKLRGFDAKDDVYLDGLRDFAAYTRDSFNYEEVQVLKGPSGLMFGRGTGGGAINSVSKTPFLGDRYSLGLEGGNGDHVRGTADLNYQLSDTAAVRLNLMLTDTGVVDRDLVHSHRWGVAPSIALGLGTDTTFTLSYVHQQTSARPDYGVVVVSPPNSVYAKPATEFGVPRNTFPGLSADYDKNSADLITTKLTHNATDWLTLENDTRVAAYSRDFRYTSADACDNTIGTNYCNLRIFGIAQPGAAAGSFDPTQTLVRTGGGGPYRQNSWGVQDIASASANFPIGQFRNMLIAGIDVSYQRADRTIYAYTLPAGPSPTLYPLNDHTASRANIGWSLYNPTHQPIPGYNAILPTAANSTGANAGKTSATATTVVTSTGDATDLAAFATDRFWFNDELSVIAGLRIDQYDAIYKSVTVAGAYTELKTPSFLFDPRASLVFEPDQTQTYYLSWGKAATPIGTSVVGSPTPIASSAASALKPDKSETLEAGAKFSTFGGKLGLTGSVFQVTKSNALQTDPVSGAVLLQSAQKQRVQGFEASATGEVIEHLSLTASYTYLNPVIAQDLTTPYNTGKQITFVPKNSASIWGDYNARDLIPGLSFGGGLVYQSHLYNGYTAPNPATYPLGRIVQIPETVELDAVAAYDIDKLHFQLNINNLTDRLYYSQSFGNRGTPAPGRTFIFSVGVNL